MEKYLDAKVVKIFDHYTIIIDKGIIDGVEDGDTAYAVYKFNVDYENEHLGEVSANIFKFKVTKVFNKFAFCESDENEFVGTFGDIMPVKKLPMPTEEGQEFVSDKTNYKNVIIGTDIELYK